MLGVRSSSESRGSRMGVMMGSGIVVRAEGEDQGHDGVRRSSKTRG